MKRIKINIAVKHFMKFSLIHDQNCQQASNSQSAFHLVKESSINLQLTLIHGDEDPNSFFLVPGRQGRCTF